MDINIKLPSNWDEVTISKFTELQSLKEAKNNTDRILNIANSISILSNIDIVTIYQLSISQLNELYKGIEFINQPIPSDIYKESIIIDNTEYVWNLKIDSLNTAQYIDLKELLKLDYNNIYKISEILAILYVPKDKKYMDVPTKEIAEVFDKNLSIQFAYNIASFFLTLLENLTDNLNNSLISETIPQLMKNYKTLKNQ